MGSWVGGVLTRAGRELQAKVEAGKTPLNITKIKLGSGQENIDDVDEYVDLLEPMAEMGISSAVVEGQVATITGIISTSTIATGFYCREWGLFAVDPDKGEILYMITVDERPEWLPPNTEAVQISATYAMNVAVANAAEIKAQIDLTGLVDTDMLHTYSHSLHRLKQYQKGDMLNAPNLPHGLVLQCVTAGTTAETLIDFSRVKCGDTVTDGSVVWRVVRYLITDSDSNLYKDFIPFMGRVVDVVKALTKTTPPFYAGVVSPTPPSDKEKVWLQTETGETFDLTQVKLETDDGETIENPLIQITSDNGKIVYLDTTGEIPAAIKDLALFDGGKFEPTPIDEDFATDEEVQELIDEILPLPNGASETQTPVVEDLDEVDDEF